MPQPSSILISGFEPFGGESINPSDQVATALADQFHTITLPVCKDRAPALLLEHLHAVQPSRILMLGEAGGNAQVTLERYARNYDDFRIPDHSGNQPRDTSIEPGAPDRYASTLPLDRIHDTLQQHHLPVQFSNSAGAYVCNHLSYQLLHYIQEQQLRIEAGFIHLPYLPAQTVSKPANTPSLALADQTKAIQLAGRVLSPREPVD